MAFKKFSLHDDVFDAIQEAGLTVPTPIQEQAIIPIMEGKDVLASAQTGTGKTAAFLLPALHRVAERLPSKIKGPRILILTPTRELAMQVAKEAARFGAGLPSVKIVCLVGGTPYPQQNRQLQKPYEILVATPGRLIDQLERGRVNLSGVEMLILDEADRMLDMGFIAPVEHIAANISKQAQVLLFSATLKKEVIKLSQKLLKDPVEIKVEPAKADTKQIDQQFRTVDGIEQKHQMLEEILKDPTINQVIVFTATKRSADELAEHLSVAGHDAGSLHGDMHQRSRTKTIRHFREGRMKILVATDVAARGIDVLTITHVINFDLPRATEDYVHRIGRTGRAGRAGVAISFVSKRDWEMWRTLAKLAGQEVPEMRKRAPFPRKGFDSRRRPRSFQKTRRF